MMDRLYDRMVKIIKENLYILLPSFLAGLAAYMFAFTNKLPNHDDVMCLFSKGATLASGRWGLEVSKYIFPNVSMPWFYGVVCLVLLCSMACLTVKIFEIRSHALTAILAASIVTFPSQTVTFGYMFTAAPYALSLLLAVLSVYTFKNTRKYRLAKSIVCLTLSMGIYQAYIGIAAGFFVVLAIKNLVDGDKDSKAIFKEGVLSAAVLIISAMLYYVINIMVLKISGITLGAYSEAHFSSGGIISKIVLAYRNFISYFYSGHYDIIRRDFSGAVHFICAAAVLVILCEQFLREKNKACRALLIFCLAVLPLAINCVCLISNGIHNLMTVGMTSLYVLTAVLVETAAERSKKSGKGLITAALLIVTISNIAYANEIYTKMYLQYESANSFYTGVVTQVKMTPGFDENSKLAIVGDAHNLIYDVPEIDTDDVAGVMEGMINIYSRNEFIKYYTGFNIPMASNDEISRIMNMDEFKSMPDYPYYGSVCKIGDFIVVKFS